jgi:hypothetical protein
MFVTEEAHRQPGMPFLHGPGQIGWRVATFMPNVPYTFVSYAIEDEEVWVSQLSVLWRQEDVLQFCFDLQSDSRRHVLGVWLLLLEENTEEWRWVKVTEIFAGQVKHSPSEWPFYITESGAIFEGGRRYESLSYEGSRILVFPNSCGQAEEYR